MDCKLRVWNRGTRCDTHQTNSMSLLCDVAEQELRDAITQLKKTVAILRDQVEAFRVSSPIRDLSE